MEGLILSAKESFHPPEVVFQDDRTLGDMNSPQNSRDTDFRVLEIQNGVPIWQNRRNAQELSSFFADPDPADGIPRLKLVSLQSRMEQYAALGQYQVFIESSRDLFEDLCRQMKTNPWILWLISSKYDGYHYLKAQDEYADSYFFGFFHCAVIWTFVPAIASTKVMFITRGRFQPESFYDLFNSYAPHLSTPYVPLMACILKVMLNCDNELERDLERIAYVENHTGFTEKSSVPQLDEGIDVHGLTRLSRLSAHAKINIVNTLRHHENVMRALEAIRDVDTTHIFQNLDTQYRNSFNKSITEMLQAIQVLRMRGDSCRSYGAYLKDRAEAQVGVVFALLTHEDSTSNLKAAEASKEIAAAAKRDSSAMKTIAFMTMAFLPATFLAALFAVPVLEWEHKTSVRMDGLQLYWIVAILSTAFIFAVWALVTEWGWVLRKGWKRLQKKSRQKEPGIDLSRL